MGTGVSYGGGCYVWFGVIGLCVGLLQHKVNMVPASDRTPHPSCLLVIITISETIETGIRYNNYITIG